MLWLFSLFLTSTVFDTFVTGAWTGHLSKAFWMLTIEIALSDSNLGTWVFADAGMLTVNPSFLSSKTQIM